ncbi:DNA gyrase inhibitor YacG [Acidocella sp.]|nr:DNA gyrase inhibitor YacG [Acidocella sp.]
MTCPICAKPAHPAHKPFCSARCAQIDLGRWLRDDYKIPVRPTPDDEDPE